MKRLFVGVACAALLVPSLAGGSPATSVSSVTGHAKGEPQFQITFRIAIRKGKPRKVTHLKFRNAIAPCATGPTESVTFKVGTPGLGPYRVNNRRKFGRKFSVEWGAGKMAKRGTANGNVTVRGRFNRRVTKARGMLRAKGSPPPSYTGCDTGRIRWVARIR
jgi:hypothetical protein